LAKNLKGEILKCREEKIRYFQFDTNIFVVAVIKFIEVVRFWIGARRIL